ncbi:MAG: hypothetical protein ACJZ39_01435 [Candidatus Thalassarchaeaceae archaeon]
MSDGALFKMPTIDLSAKSLLMLSQLGIFVCFAFWSLAEGAEDNIDYVFPAMIRDCRFGTLPFSPKREDGGNLGSSSVDGRDGLGYG